MKKRFSRLRLKRVKRHLNAMRRKPVKTYLERAQKTALDRDIGKLKKELENRFISLYNSPIVVLYKFLYFISSKNQSSFVNKSFILISFKLLSIK